MLEHVADGCRPRSRGGRLESLGFMIGVDAARFPRLASRLSFLPQGLASHPGRQAKGVLVRAVVDCEPLADVPEGARRKSNLPNR